VPYFRALHPSISPRSAQLSSVSFCEGQRGKWQCAVFLVEYFRLFLGRRHVLRAHYHTSPPKHPARLLKFDHCCCRYKSAVPKTEECDVWAHGYFVSNPIEVGKWQHVWLGLGDVIPQFYSRWCQSVCSELVKGDVSILGFNKFRPVRLKTIRNYVLVPRSFANICWSPLWSHHELGFSNLLQRAVDSHTLLCRASLKAFLLTLTYNLIIRFGLSSSFSPPPHLFLDIRDLDWFNLILQAMFDRLADETVQ
jgi:hypothetical protein